MRTFKNFIKKLQTLLPLIIIIPFYQNCSESFKVASPAIDKSLSMASSTQPKLIIKNPPSGFVNKNNVSISLSAVANGNAKIASIMCALNSSDYVECKQGFNKTGLSEGNQVLRVQAVDSDGILSKEEVISWTVDTIIPKASFSTVPSQSISTKNLALSYSVSDTGSGISGVSCTLNSNPISCTNNLLNLSNLSNGAKEIKIVVTDKAQNSYTLTSNFNVQLSEQPVNTIEKTLSWNPPLKDGQPDNSILSYNVHVGTSSGVYDQVISVEAKANPSVVLTLEKGKTYYIAVVAVNDLGEGDKTELVYSVPK